MNIFIIVLLASVVINLTFVVIRLIFKYCIEKSIIKPSKISKIFYRDDESFINYWNQIQEKGILKYVIKIVIVQAAIGDMIATAVIQYRQETGTQFRYLAIAPIVGLIVSAIYWRDNSNRYKQLKEK